MKVLIIEPNSSGHNMAMHLKIIIRKLIKSKCEISLLTTKSAVNSASYNLVKEEMDKKINEYFIADTINTKNNSSIAIFYKQLKLWFVIKKKFLQINTIIKPDIILIPTLDWIAKSVEILGSPFENTPFVTLYMAPKHHRKTMGLGLSSRQDWIYDILFRKLLKIPTLKNLFVFEKTFIEYAKKRYKKFSGKIKFIPDFGLIKLKSTKKQARFNLGINQNSKVILVYGSLSVRKGINELLKAMLCEEIPKNIVILLSGKPDEETIKLLKNPNFKNLINFKKIFIFFKFHNTFEEQQAFAAADAVWLGYAEGFDQSSGILYQAIQADLLLIGRNSGIIGKYINEYHLGVTVSPSKTKSVVSTIKHLFDKEKSFYNKSKKERKFLKDLHSPERYSSILFNVLKESLTKK